MTPQQILEWLKDDNVLLTLLTTILIPVLTLLGTYLAVWLAKKGNKQTKDIHEQDMSRIPEWELTKVGDYTWILERTLPNPVLIHQFFGDPLCSTDFDVSVRGLKGVGTLYRAYTINDKLVLDITPREGFDRITSEFHICYKEVEKGTEDPHYFVAHTGMHDSGFCGGKCWTNPLY